MVVRHSTIVSGDLVRPVRPASIVAVFCRDPRSESQISWRTTVAHQSTEDTSDRHQIDQEL
jgi:hypothetical protein